MTQVIGFGITNVRKDDGKDLCISLQSMSLLRNLFVMVTDEEYLEINSPAFAPTALKNLVLVGKLETVPHWFCSLQNLTSLYLHLSKLIEDLLPHIQGLANLGELALIKAYAGSKLCFSTGFNKLVHSYFRSLSQLDEIIIEKGVIMPGLQRIYVGNCTELKMLPRGIEYLTSLEKLDLVSPVSTEHLESIRDEDSVDRPRVRHIPEIYHLASGISHDSLSGLDLKKVRNSSARIMSVMEDESASYVHGGLAPVANVQNIAIDTKSPFYLHPSDHPGLIFVTQPLSENGENYFTWRRNMLTALQSKNKAGFVDGLIAKPDVHSRDFQSWIQCNAVVKSWIVNSLSRELQTSAAHADTASEIWCDFDERFTQGIALRVYDLKRSIALLQQEKSAISTYYGKLKGVWNELHNLRPIPVCTCGAGKKMQEMREEEKVFDFLMGLDDTYKTVRSQILSIDPLPGLGRAYAVAAQEEKQQVVAAAHVPTIEATTLLAKAPHMRHGGDQKIDRRGENSGERRHGGLHCTQCNRSNHSRENCYEIIGYPPGWRRPKPRGGNQPWLRASGGTTSSAAIAQPFAATADASAPFPNHSPAYQPWSRTAGDTAPATRVSQ
ncbi:hypothetical protein RJ639_044716 [Escallonia herrerae]|uniref:Retrotransposon Copia-like N-terminal domain-containing protein n=1 Tax=Escallonia herrerae TaxID=1293975 RepID=A0AA89B365_9ASTE|nr:hypothetical protein RJ639_044716 [Escallonia herrerae]